MKRVLSLITVLVLILGLMIPSLSLAASTPAIRSLSAGTTSASVSWNAVGGVQGYEIAWGRKGVSDWLDRHATTTGTCVTVTGLSEDTTYVFRVRAYYKCGTSTKYTSWSAKKSVKTQSSKPATPSITGLSASNGRVTVKWNKDSRAVGYEIQWDEKGRAGWRSYVDVRGTGSYTASTRIITGATMAFRIRAYWYEGKKLKYTSWSATKYVYVKPVGKSCEPSWSAWGAWTRTREATNANKQEESIKGYHWWAARCKNCGTHNPYWGSSTKCKGCGKMLPAENVTHVHAYTTDKANMKTILGRSNGRVINGGNYWYADANVTFYRYRTRK